MSFEHLAARVKHSQNQIAGQIQLTERVLNRQFNRALSFNGREDDISTTNLGTTRWGTDDKGTWLAATRILKVSMSEVVYVPLAFPETQAAEDGLSVIDYTLWVAGTSGGEGGGTIRTVVFLAEAGILSLDQNKSTKKCGDMYGESHVWVGERNSWLEFVFRIYKSNLNKNWEI